MLFRTIALCLLCQVCIAQPLQDVIYKKDGSILRGLLVEQDFENAHFKIQLINGSVFSIAQHDIDKITKELPFSNTTSTNQVSINIENNPSIHQTPSTLQAPEIKQSSQPQTTISPINTVYDHDHVAMVGMMSKTFKAGNRKNSEISFSGLNLSYQVNITNGFAILLDHQRSTSGKISDGSLNPDFSNYNIEEANYYGTQLAAIFSSNTRKVFQFYTGIGAFRENLKLTTNKSFNSEPVLGLQSGDNIATGPMLLFGAALSGRHYQMQFRFSMYKSDDYPEDAWSNSASFSIGHNF
jgi:hypothetical protein